MRLACSSCKIRAKKELGCFGFGRYARARVQLQHSRKTARFRSALRLYQVTVLPNLGLDELSDALPCILRNPSF